MGFEIKFNHLKKKEKSVFT